MENINLKDIIEETIRKEVRRAILENTTSKEVYIIKNKKGEPVEICQSQQEAEEKKKGYESKHPDQELIIEPGDEPTFEELDAMSEKLDNMENTKEKSTKHKGHFTMEQVMKLAEKACQMAPESKEYFEELCETYGEKIPAQNVFEILEDYEMSELMSKIKVKEMEYKEGNAFGDAVRKAKEAGDDSFKVGGKKFDVEEEEEACEGCGGGMSSMEEDDERVEVEIPEGDMCEKCGKELCECGSGMQEDEIEEGGGMCEKCGKELCECGGMYESKKSVRLTEAELVNLISGMVNEAVPGLSTFQKAHKESGVQNSQALSDVEKKIKQYLTFDGNDNPEFPGHNKGDVEARQSSGDEADEIADNRGGGLEDLEYDVEPSDKFKERLKMSLNGDSKMGNAQEGVGNVIPSKLGEKMIKKVKRKEEAKKAAPMYVKDPAPIKNVNESIVISEEIKRMKEMLMYNKKTQ